MAKPKQSLGSKLFGRFLGSAVSNAAGYGVGGAILPTLEPLTQDLTNETWSAHPSRPIPVSAVAQAVTQGFMGEAEGVEEAARTGFDATRFSRIQELSQSPPPLETIIDLYRRGAIGEGQLERGIQQSGYLFEWRDFLKARINVLPSVTDMIRFAVREVFNPSQRDALDLDAEYPPAFGDAAKKIGIDGDLSRDYWAAHWELPSYTQATEMLFRGEITETQFNGLLKALDYAPTWRGPLQAIARRIPTITDMIRFAVREVYNPQLRAQLGIDAEYPEAFTAKAAMHGMNEADARDYWAAHWRLPSAQQGYRMLWRGEITQSDLDALLKALDYPTKWRAPLSNIARLVPGRIDLKRMLRHEILTRAEVKAGYQKLGYTETDAERLTRIAEAEMASSETASPWANRARSRLFTVTHNEYVDESIDATRAKALLAQVGAGPNEAVTILQLWDAEKQVNRLELTPAQIRKAYTKDLYTRDVAIAELAERGMTAEDAAVFLDS